VSQSETVVKKSDNGPRLVRLENEMNELKFLDRMISEIMSPIRERKQQHAVRIRELLLDEGIAPDLLARVASIEVDPAKCEVRYVMKPEPPKGPKLNPDPEKPSVAAKKKAAAKRKPPRKR